MKYPNMWTLDKSFEFVFYTFEKCGKETPDDFNNRDETSTKTETKDSTNAANPGQSK